MRLPTIQEITRTRARLPAITIQPPYADLIAKGFKVVENRSRPVPWTGLTGRMVAIHSGKSRDWLATDPEPEIPHDELRFGGIVAVATVEHVESFETVVRDDRFIAWRGKHLNGPICLLLGSIQEVEFVACNGSQGLWYVPDSLWKA